MQGSASTIRQPVTPDLWSAHLDGDYGLGIVPIREDSTASWGAIDIDVYTGLEHARIAADLARLKLPLLTTRTKSGGAHLYLFLTEPAPAGLVREKLMEWSVALGYAGVEVFPKQVKLTDSENDLGNWINMPYYAGARSTRYAVGADGKALTTTAFIDAAVASQITPEALSELQPLADELVTELLADGPPCLQSLAIHGFPQGTRNNGMFNVGIYLQKRYPDDWKDYTQAYNDRLMSPPLNNKEIRAIENSIKKKSYNYKCQDQPICNACNRQICLTRKFGVGGNDDDPGVVFGDLVQIQTEPDVSYIWDVDGIRIQFSSARQILDQRIFHQHAMDRIRKLPNFVSEKTWRGIVREKLETAQVVVPPRDATPSGQLEEHLYAFLTQRAQAHEFDELLLNRPYTDKNGVCYFRVKDFIDHLKRYRVSGVTEPQLYRWLSSIGAESGKKRAKGRLIRYWTIAGIEKQNEDFKVPEIETKEIDE